MKKLSFLALVLSVSAGASAQILTSKTFSYSYQDDQGGPVTMNNLDSGQLATSGSSSIVQTVPDLIIDQVNSSADVYGGFTWSLNWDASSLGPNATFGSVTINLQGTYSQPYGYYSSELLCEQLHRLLSGQCNRHRLRRRDSHGLDRDQSRDRPCRHGAAERPLRGRRQALDSVRDIVLPAEPGWAGGIRLPVRRSCRILAVLRLGSGIRDVNSRTRRCSRIRLELFGRSAPSA